MRGEQMSQLDVLLEPVPSSQRLCKMGKIVDQLDEPYKSAVVSLLATSFDEGGFTERQLSERFAIAGLRVGMTIIYYHRNNLCNCQKKVVVR